MSYSLSVNVVNSSVNENSLSAVATFSNPSLPAIQPTALTIRSNGIVIKPLTNPEIAPKIPPTIPASLNPFKDSLTVSKATKIKLSGAKSLPTTFPIAAAPFVRSLNGLINLVKNSPTTPNDCLTPFSVLPMPKTVFCSLVAFLLSSCVPLSPL